MFSVLFPGQGSQSVGMAKDLYNNFDYVKVLFEEAEDTLSLSIKKIIFVLLSLEISLRKQLRTSTKITLLI